jgi:hypothetical protein
MNLMILLWLKQINLAAYEIKTLAVNWVIKLFASLYWLGEIVMRMCCKFLANADKICLKIT